MKSVRPGLAVTVGAFSIIQLVFSVVAIALTATANTFNAWWGFGGAIGALVASFFGLIGGFGRFRFSLIIYTIFSFISTAFLLTTSSLFWRDIAVAPLVDVPAAASAFCFITAVFAFVGSIIGFAAVVSRRRDMATTGPAWQVEEAARANVIRMNRTVVAFSILQMLISIPALVIAAIDGTTASWWIFGGTVGLLVASIFGLIAGLRARRGMHILYSLLSYTALAFALVGCGEFFNFIRFVSTLTPFQNAVLSMGFIDAVLSFVGATVSMATVFMYRRRLLPVAAAYPTAVPVVQPVVQPTVVIGEEQRPADQAWGQPAVSPRVQPAGQAAVERPTVVEPSPYPAPTATTAPAVTRV